MDGTVKDNEYLFKDTKIMESAKKYIKHMGKYSVINLSLKSAKQPNYQFAYKCLKDQIINEFDRHRYILKSDSVTERDKEIFNKIYNEEDNSELYITSLKFLSECLEKYNGKKVIILIDEYDVPLENSYFRGFYTEMVDFIRSIFKSALKTNNSLGFEVLTGCLYTKVWNSFLQKGLYD